MFVLTVVVPLHHAVSLIIRIICIFNLYSSLKIEFACVAIIMQVTASQCCCSKTEGM